MAHESAIDLPEDERKLYGLERPRPAATRSRPFRRITPRSHPCTGVNHTIEGIELGQPPASLPDAGGESFEAHERSQVDTSKFNESAPTLVRLVQGSLMAGHGAQKLFGSFGGPGLEGTSGFMEMLGLRPGRPWAYLAGLSEFGGGVLTALGLLNPLGPLGVIGSMAMASVKAHGGKPIWVTEGGAELPVT